MKIIGNAFVFVISYLVFMFPTYLLPYLGSNSASLNSLGVAADAGMSPMFIYHFGALVSLMVLTWFRGVFIDKKWLLIFPFLAAAFDLLPLLRMIPLVPTVMHLLAIILGVACSTVRVPINNEAIRESLN